MLLTESAIEKMTLSITEEIRVQAPIRLDVCNINRATGAVQRGCGKYTAADET